MMGDPVTLKIIAGWIVGLANLCLHGKDGPPTKDKIAVYATMLGMEFPAAAFTPKSLHAVVLGEGDPDNNDQSKQGWFPSYEIVHRRLGAWWRQHGPAYVRALPGQTEVAANELVGWDRYWFEFYWRRAAEKFGSVDGRRPTTRNNVLSLIKQQSPQAWQALMNSGVEAVREHLG